VKYAVIPNAPRGMRPIDDERIAQDPIVVIEEVHYQGRRCEPEHRIPKPLTMPYQFWTRTEFVDPKVGSHTMP